MARFNNLGKAIGIAIKKDEDGIRQLLKRNGVDTSKIRTKQQLSDSFVTALFKSKGLAKDFSNYVKSKASGQSNFDGKYSNYTAEPVSVLTPMGIGGIGATIGTTAIDTAKTKATSTSEPSPMIDDKKSGFFSGLNLADLLNTVSTVYVASQTNKGANADSVNQTQQASTDVINSDFDGSANKSNTAMYVILGATVIGLGVLTYVLATKKK